MDTWWRMSPQTKQWKLYYCKFSEAVGSILTSSCRSLDLLCAFSLAPWSSFSSNKSMAVPSAMMILSHSKRPPAVFGGSCTTGPSARLYPLSDPLLLLLLFADSLWWGLVSSMWQMCEKLLYKQSQQMQLGPFAPMQGQIQVFIVGKQNQVQNVHLINKKSQGQVGFPLVAGQHYWLFQCMTLSF